MSVVGLQRGVLKEGCMQSGRMELKTEKLHELAGRSSRSGDPCDAVVGCRGV